jgi:hypothetical protein
MEAISRNTKVHKQKEDNSSDDGHTYFESVFSVLAPCTRVQKLRRSYLGPVVSFRFNYYWKHF